MNIRETYWRWLVRLATLMLCVGIFISYRHSLDIASNRAEFAMPPLPEEEELFAGLVISQESGEGDVLSAQRVCTRLLHHGPISFGVRELVIEGLDLALPESYFEVPEKGVSPHAAGLSAAVESLAADDGKGCARLPRVVGLNVSQLRIARIEGGTNVVPWLMAKSAKNKGSDLRLRDVTIYDRNATNVWREAKLSYKPSLSITPIR